MIAEKPVLLLIPGLLCDGRVWRDIIPLLADLAEPRVIEGLDAYDTIPGMARAALDAHPGVLAVAGFSLGGRIALEMVRQAPERIARLALLGSGYGPAKPHEAEDRLGLVRLARQRGMRAMADLWLPPMLKPDHQNGPMGDDLMDMVVTRDIDGFERQELALLHRPDATPVLGTIAVPTLVLTGRQDSWSPVTQNQAMAALIPGARFTAIDDSGHFTMTEQPEAVAREMREWLSW